MTSPKFSSRAGFLVGLGITPVAFFLALYSAGAGHGDYGLARPVPMLATLLTNTTITGLSIGLAALQFPAYGDLLRAPAAPDGWPLASSILSQSQQPSAASWKASRDDAPVRYPGASPSSRKSRPLRKAPSQSLRGEGGIDLKQPLINEAIIPYLHLDELVILHRWIGLPALTGHPKFGHDGFDLTKSKHLPVVSLSLGAKIVTRRDRKTCHAVRIGESERLRWELSQSHNE